MNILVTAIGSMSASCVIKSLKEAGHFVVGCDIYPGEWHHETSLCDIFSRSPLAESLEYVPFLIDIIRNYKIDYLFPLTDLEIDVLVQHRNLFESENCCLCISDNVTIGLARNKYRLFEFFSEDKFVPTIASVQLGGDLDIEQFVDFPYILKPCNGRSSEGLRKVSSASELSLYLKNENYLLQKYLEGPVFTVDYVRQHSSNMWIAVPRKELLRTTNGAGLTVEIILDNKLIELAHHIAEKIRVNGCINMEFILSRDKYYLIDVNPRFSAGVAFSKKAGVDMVLNHLKCFSKEQDVLVYPSGLTQQIMSKIHSEITL